MHSLYLNSYIWHHTSTLFFVFSVSSCPPRPNVPFGTGGGAFCPGSLKSALRIFYIAKHPCSFIMTNNDYCIDHIIGRYNW